MCWVHKCFKRPTDWVLTVCSPEWIWWYCCWCSSIVTSFLTNCAFGLCVSDSTCFTEIIKKLNWKKQKTSSEEVWQRHFTLFFPHSEADGVISCSLRNHNHIILRDLDTVFQIQCTKSFYWYSFTGLNLSVDSLSGPECNISYNTCENLWETC